MKNIGAFAPFLVIAALVLVAVFGGRMLDKPKSPSNSQFNSMNLSTIMALPTKESLAVNQTSTALIINAIHSQNGTSSGGVQTVTNNLTFTSANEKVAVVNAAGQITGVAAGSTTVTVSYTERGATKTVDVPVTITAPPAPPTT